MKDHSGGIAGTSVDIALYPLDTLKTRLQSAKGFFKSGGFRGIYSGLSAAAIGSAPGASLFFSTYETSKSKLLIHFPENKYNLLIHMIAASLGEMSACLVRVPTEIIKQRIQAGMEQNAKNTFLSIIRKEGIIGLYRGYNTMLAREIPFAIIQFPLWETLKSHWSSFQNTPISPFQGAICGSIAGSIAAAATTPLDVIKTRMMLKKDAKDIVYKNGIDIFKRILKEEGIKTLFSGIGPRTVWIGIGGFVFFGMYEIVLASLVTLDK